MNDDTIVFFGNLKLGEIAQLIADALGGKCVEKSSKRYEIHMATDRGYGIVWIDNIGPDEEDVPFASACAVLKMGRDWDMPEVFEVVKRVGVPMMLLANFDRPVARHLMPARA